MEKKLSVDYAGTNSSEDKCKQWIENSEFTTSDDVSSISGQSTEFSSSAIESDLASIDDGLSNIDINKGQHSQWKTADTNVKIIAPVTDISQTEILHNVFKGNTAQSFENIQVEHSNKVHIGNVTYVTGPIHIIHTSGSNVGSVQQFITSAQPIPTTSQSSSEHTHRSEKPRTSTKRDPTEEERNHDEAFLPDMSKRIYSRVLKIVDRRTWLAQPALDFEELNTPVPYVVISHTATESADTQAGMIYMVRNIQCFHIESRRWNDIAYNFLVGNDGNVYEGRGWKRIGAHTAGYNSQAIGISFVGCFMKELPEQIALDACRLLIERGVQNGFILPDYKLVAHCQCSPTESPGRRLFEEIKTWPHWTADPQTKD
ncbi:peptidoglycan-recognition protein LE [Uranotaenia lowii]|uniref:peptidoglycan-recognition protein LE n=1 Tax=Uranotaenia lowii TaxID=190385 RepID=UPI00247B0D1E|nr:peptidoglycan-recognition protein LE [Uranotaenia lowii]XP_055585851.1 peptidoglycan-recognition protein LE [Uranotaenia lowii]